MKRMRLATQPSPPIKARPRSQSATRSSLSPSACSFQAAPVP